MQWGRGGRGEAALLLRGEGRNNRSAPGNHIPKKTSAPVSRKAPRREAKLPPSSPTHSPVSRDDHRAEPDEAKFIVRVMGFMVVPYRILGRLSRFEKNLTHTFELEADLRFDFQFNKKQKVTKKVSFRELGRALR